MWSYNFGYEFGYDAFRVDKHPPFFADVDGDGLPDVVEFAHAGVYVGISTGSGFMATQRWTELFGYSQGWRASMYPRFLADVDGDGLLDAVGFGTRGVDVAREFPAAFE